MTTISKIAAVLGVVAGLGVAALPISTFAASENITVSITVDSSLGGDTTICTDAGEAGGPGAPIEAACELEGSSNNGLTISIEDYDADLNLRITPEVNISTDPYIAPISAAEVAAGFSQYGWGYRYIDTTGVGAGKATVTNNATYFRPITAKGSPFTAATYTSGTFSGEFGFAANIQSTQELGTYEDVVIVTLTPQ